MIEPGQTYNRAGVIAVVLRKRKTPPDEWGNVCTKAHQHLRIMPVGDWFDVLNIASETDLPFHDPGKIVAWHESLFEDKRCKRLS